jgi:hypothetical protein
VGGSENSHPGGRAGNDSGVRREQTAFRTALALPGRTAFAPSAIRGKGSKKAFTPEEVIPMNEGAFKDF